MINVKDRGIQRKIIRGICINLKYEFKHEENVFKLYRNCRDKIHENVMFQGDFKKMMNFLQRKYRNTD